MLSLAAAAGLALVHLLAGRLRFLDVVPRSRWLSFGGGISVAYVFVHLLPELGEAQRVVARGAGPLLARLDHHVYVLAAAGLTLFYGLERAANESRRTRRGEGGEDRASDRVFWLHAALFGVYNALVGSLLVERGEDDAGALWTFSLAMALHFLVNDFGLREHHRGVYERLGRWVLAGAVLAGWALGRWAHPPEEARAVALAVLSGGVVLNVLKEELPEERQSRFGAFALGVAGYAAVLLAAG